MPVMLRSLDTLQYQAVRGVQLMTSKERREGRYKRRKAKREQKRLMLLDTYNFDRVVDPDNLYKAMKDSRSGVYWKASVQRYNMNYLKNILKVRNELLAGNDIRKGFIEFTLTERGKARNIRAVHFIERVVQKSLCNEALLPFLIRTLIYDNPASIKDKGIHFGINRVKTHLRQHYKEHGTSGYVLTLDFCNYFGNILHEPLRQIFIKAFGEDKRLVDLSMLFIEAFGDHGMGLGSEISQIAAVTYANRIDHYIKEFLTIKYYGRYMDDSYFICETKEQAQEILSAILIKYDEMGIVTRPDKIAITKLSKGFTFLKVQFSITPTGKVLTRPSRKGITRHRRKLNKFKKMYDAGLMSLYDIRGSHMSWRGYISHMQARRTIRNMDNLYYKLFGMSPLIKLPKQKTEELFNE